MHSSRAGAPQVLPPSCQLRPTAMPLDGFTPRHPHALLSSLGCASSHDPAARCSATHSEHFDFVVVATGLFNQPLRPEWAEGLASATPPPASADRPWVVDAKEFTDQKLPLAQVPPEV